jgi:hypothetical protein
MSLRKPAGPFLAYLLGLTGLVLIWANALLIDATRGIFRADAFASRAAASLGDPRVSAFVAEKITDGIVAQSPDLTAVRPLILGTANGLVQSEPFRAAVRTALRTAHRSVFSEGGQEMLLSVPDVGILVKSALAGASPQLAAKIPERVETALADLPQGRISSAVVTAFRIWSRLRWLAGALLLIGPLLLFVGVLVHPDRRHALVRAGLGLLIVGLLLALIVPAGRLVALALVKDDLARGALFGVWRAYFLQLFGWAITLGGTGLVLAAAGNSLHETVNPFERLRQLARVAVQPPEPRGARLLWVLSVAAAGTVLLVWPSSVLAGLAVLGGLLLIFAALREMFRLVLENVPEHGGATITVAGRRWPLRTAIGLGLAASLVIAVIIWRRPTAETPGAGFVTSCNGALVLCGRTVDQVVFPGAHNAMSNADIPGWMFPHHSHDMRRQLEAGVRALLIDVHYGFPGGARVKTDLEGEGATHDKLVGAVGEEGVAAAERIRNRLVGVDEGHRRLYFCHGFCELGAYEVVPALREIRSWLVANPDEVIVLVIEDYVTPQEIAQAFHDSGLFDFVYTGTIEPWPSLREMVESNARVLVFTESGKPGVDWVHPAFVSIQETPYTFHKPEDFSCKPNRGGTSGTLFQINHWIETTPAPRPSNAAIVNAYDFLLQGARTCQRERKHLPNIIAVDFIDVGDVVRVARTLNGLDSTTAQSTP